MAAINARGCLDRCQSLFKDIKLAAVALPQLQEVAMAAAGATIVSEAEAAALCPLQVRSVCLSVLAFEKNTM